MYKRQVQPTLNLKELKEIKFRIPPLAEQRAIAGVLGSLDDKIDLLQRQNSTLEATVSYTHLDVYKRQGPRCGGMNMTP